MVGRRRLGGGPGLGVPLGAHRAHRRPGRRYREACERSRGIAATMDLDQIGADTERPPFTLRYVLVHMIEETARHLGHLDVLRELLDGTTGE